jgi:hypothetical protein
MHDLDSTFFDPDYYIPAAFHAALALKPLFQLTGAVSVESYTEVTLQDAFVAAILDPVAPAHSSIVGENLDPNDGKTPIITFANDPAQFPVAARAPTPLVTTTTGLLGAPLSTLEYKLSTASAALVTITSSPSTSSTAGPPVTWVYGPSGTAAELWSTDGGNGMFPVASASSMYAVIYGAGFAGSSTDTIDTTPTIYPATPNTEAASAHSAVATAQSVSPQNFAGSLVISGSLATANEIDV